MKSKQLLTVLAFFGLSTVFINFEKKKDQQQGHEKNSSQNSKKPIIMGGSQADDQNYPRLKGRKVKAVDISKLKNNKDRLNYYFNCLEYQQCESIPTNDPRMYEIEIGARIVDELKELYQQNDLDQAERDLVSKSMQTLNGHVQAQALQFYESFERTPENLKEVVAGLKNSEFDIVLIDKAMPLLQEYFQNPETRDTVFQYVSDQVQSGSYLSSEYFAKKITTFLTEDNIQVIEEIYRDLSPEKHTHKYLKSAIENYKMMRSGG